MAPLDGYLKDQEYKNWVKCGLALNITNEVLRPFVVKEITELHQSIVKKLPSGVSCGGCRVNTSCPKCICDKIQREIEIQHWYGKPSFTNTCTGRWSTGPWEIAKCYMPPSKGSRCSSDSDADFTASINVIINCKHFQAFGTNDPNGTPESNLSKSRDFRNSIMHVSPQKVSNHYMNENLDILINIINMVKAPETKAEVEESIKGIEKIKTDQLELKLEDVIEVRKNATEAIADKSEKQSDQVQRERMLVNFEAGCRKALCRLTEKHISKQEENLSVADFLSKIRIFAVVKDLCLRHKEMLFPRYGTQKDIREWDLFVYCFILEELDVSEPSEEAVLNFVRVVKTIRDKLLVDATAVTQNDLSELCEYLIDTDLNTEITHIFNKDSSNVDVIHSNNILVSWWREEEDYGNKQVSKKQLNNNKLIMEEVDKQIAENNDKIVQAFRVMLRDREEHVTLQGANAAEIGAECELKVHGCDKKTEKALQRDITSPNINGVEKMEALNYFRDQRNLLEVDPVEGSIILKVTCSSTTNVLDFWDSCIDGRAVEALSKVRDYYRRYFKCDTLEFDVILTKKGVARCVNERVRGLSSQLEGLTHKVIDEVYYILESKEKELIQWSSEDDFESDIEKELIQWSSKDDFESDIDEDLITGSVENLTFGDEGGDDQASLAASDSDGELDATFSCMEQPPLIKQLRGILSEYPDNGQIIKELLQNAEEARAREVEIIYDERIINQSDDKKKPFRKFFKGPALCVKNNSQFADRDWKGIKMVASSVKEDDKLKVGRFGLGFKSVFHMTDFPCIISGERVLLIDPTRPSDQVNAEMKLKDLRRIRGMDVEAFLEALGSLGINETIINKGIYPGTVFWFPLRNETSKISSTLYDREKIMDLFSSFEHDSSEVLIFLSHLESVSLHIKNTSGVINKVAGAEITENKLNIRKERMEFVKKIEGSSYPKHSPFVCSYKMNIQSTTRDGSVDDTMWAIVHYFMGNNSSQTLQNLVADPDLEYNPLVGVAMPVTSSSSAKFEGRDFCFLPLPKEGQRLTGLPVHINGFFSLSQNRHHMKWATDDQDKSKVKDKNVVWNRTLIEECLPEAYKNLFGMLLEMSKINGNTYASVDVTYKAVPDETTVLDKWKRIPEKLLPYLHQLPFLYSKSRQRYVVIKEALFATFRDLKPDIARLQEDIAHTISCMSVPYVSTDFETFQKLEFYNRGMMNDLTPIRFADMLRQESRVLEQLTRSQKLSALAYLLSSGDYSCLHGLKLLPVASGTWSAYGTGSPVFLCGSEEQELFPEFAARMIIPSDDFDENVRNHFKKMASMDTYQLKSFNKNSLRDFLREALQLKVGTSYTITNQAQLNWLQKVWCYIISNPANIDNRTDIPIIPEIGTDWNASMKIQLHPMSSLFLKGDEVPEDVCDCFRKLGVTILPYFPTWLTEVNMSRFTTVHLPQRDSMNHLLGKVWSLPGRKNLVDRFNQEVSELHKDKFVEFMSTYSLYLNAIKLLKSLSIFRFGSKPFDAKMYDRYTSLDNSPEFFAASDIPVKLPRAFVIGTQESTYSLLRNLEAKEEDRISLVKIILVEMKNERHYREEEIKKFMQYFFENFGEFERNQILVELASEIPFVATDTRKLRPKDLFNPDDTLVWNLFDGQKDKFPLILRGMNDRTKYAMKRLGLKERDMITPDDIAESAEMVSSSSHDKRKHTLCVTKSKAIFTVLNTKTSMLQQQVQGNTLKSKLCQLKCIQCALDIPSHYPPSLPWYPKLCSKSFCTPVEARIKDYKNECLAGSTMPLVESAFEHLHTAFGWNCVPPLEKVIDQLTYVKQHYKMQERPSVLPLVNQIYEVLSTNVMATNLDKLKTNALIWTGDSFEEPGDIVITLKGSDLQSLIPYAYSIPPEFSRYEELFKTVGCHLEQSAFVLIRVLDKIQTKHMQVQTSEQYEKDCELVLKIVSKLAEKRAEITGKDVLLPVQTNTTFNQLQFRRASECTFDKNASRYEHEEGDNSIVFVSEIIPLDVAKALGAKPLNIQILSGTESMGIEGFGQSEKLTDRIQKLISESYVDGLSVPKELIQNADDAGATTVKFLYDERQHDDSGTLLLSKEMAHCQGPSIVVYNDATFTDSDFNNIRKLNGATKEMDANKIGRFGLGFCAVYNLTDVPSFISKNNVVMFDPQKTYLTEALEDNSPGIKIDFRRVENRKLLRLYPEQFKPFQDLFDCDVNKLQESGFPGTLFRLPLRTSAQARTSTICNVCYSSNEVHELLSKFVENAGNMLLFTQHVKHLELYHIPKGAKSVSEKVLLFKATKTSNGDSSIASHSTVLQRVTTSLGAKQHFREYERFIVSAQLTPECRSFFPKLDIQEDTVSSPWVVAWETGKYESLDLSKKIKGKRAIPISAVAVQCDDGFKRPLRENELSSLFYKTGHMFCFLPLPIKTHLKVQINGSFDVTSDRRRLITLTDDDKDSRQNKWNESLLKDASVNAFFSLLELFSCEKFDGAYFDLWPSDCSMEVNPFRNNFYKRALSENRRVFYGEGKFVSFSEITFLSRNLRDNQDIGQIGFNMLSAIGEHRGKTLVDLPQHIEMGLEQVPGISFPSIEETEFLELFLKHINHNYWNGRVEERNAILVYALRSSNEDIKKRIEDCSCIPVQPNGTLKKPCEVIDIDGKLSQLFTVDDEVFLHENLQKMHVSKYLLKLGMIKDVLPVPVLIERFSTIELLALHKCTRCALRRCQLLLHYLNEYKVRTSLKESKVVKEAVANMYILPVLQRPNGWCFSWKGDVANDQNDEEVKLFSRTTCCKDHSKEGPCKLSLGMTRSLFSKELHKAGATVISVVDETILKGERFTIHDTVFEILGVQSSIPINIIIKHMTVLSHEYINVDKQYEQLQSIIGFVNGMLQSMIKSSQDEIRQTVVIELQKLKDIPIILVGKKLYVPHNVAFDINQECPPHLVKLPVTDAITKKELFEELGVKARFTASDIIEVLKEKKALWINKPCAEIDVIVKLLENLCKCWDDKVLEDDENIVAPDIHDHLYPMHDLVIANDDFESDVLMHVLHQSIPPAIAETFGAKHKQRKCFEEITTWFGEPFGQNERLVTRLNNILDSYPCDSSIMKELLQNADDAHATQIHFIKDFRCHSKERIFDEKCASFQGPSLCVFNDSYFTEQDLRGIHDLGEGSKRRDPTKTGQYGVGFNSVYHLTDTPSFLSRGPGLPDEGLLIIFDPTCNHLPGVKREEPGLKCKVKEVQANFPDILAGFTSGDSLFKENKGTLFRFPLRTSQSEISKHIHCKTTISDILDEMSKDMLESLLFVKNVECIKVSNLSSGKFMEEYSVKSVIDEANKEKRAHFFQEVEKICKDFKNDKSSMLTIEPLEVSYKMTLVDTRGMNETFLVVQRFGFWDQQDISDTIVQAFQNDYLGCLPLGGVAYRMTEHFPKESVPVIAFKGHPHVSHHETYEEQNHLDIKRRKKSKMFCFLPIPGDTYLPVHVNGHFALDNARRVMCKDGFKKDWNQCLLKNVVVPAYIGCMTNWRDFVSDKLTTANNWLLVNQISELYHSIFPLTEPSNDDMFCKFMIASLYESMIKGKQCLFPTIKARNESFIGNQPSTQGNNEKFQWDWVPLGLEADSSCGIFNTLGSASMFQPWTDSKYKNKFALASVLKNIGMKIIHTPINVKKAIFDCEAGTPACTSPDNVVRFISTCSVEGTGQCRLSLLESNIKSTLIGSVSNLKLLVSFIKEYTSLSQYLPQLPIRLKASNVLGTFTKVDPICFSEFGWMFPNSGDSFIHCDMLGVYPTDTLKKEGYIKDFTKESFIYLIPEKCKMSINQAEPMVSWEKSLENFPSVKWISSFWKFICSISNDSKEGPSFIENVKYFSDWAFIPAVMEERAILVKISHAFMIIDDLSFIEKQDLRKSVAMFKPLKLDTDVFLKEHSCSNSSRKLDVTFSKVKSLGTSVSKPERLLEFVLFQTSLAHPPPFSKEDAICILKHFSNNLDNASFKSCPMLKEKLMSLPFFVTLNNSTVSLQSARYIFVIPPTMPVAGVDNLSKQTGVIFLKENKELHDLYKYLGLSDMTVSSLYANHILPQMSYISRNFWLQHIEYLRDSVLVYGNVQNTDQNMMIRLLRDMAFIETKFGHKCCSELFDRLNVHFQKLCDEHEFLPQIFEQYAWKDLLKALGTHFKLTDDLLLEFARRIETRASTDGLIKQRSETLVECLISKLSQWKTETLKGLAKIRFILPIELKTVYRQSFPPKDDGFNLVCMHNSVEAKNVELCWSTLHILPFSIKSGYHEVLGIHTNPPLLDVLKHCQNVSTQMKKNMIYNSDDITLLINMWYSFLDKNATNPLTKKMLIDFPIIHLPSESKMVKLNDIVIELASYEAVEPYLFKAPVEYGPFFKLFQALGTSKEVKCYHYMNILKSIAIEAENEELTIKELHTVKKAIDLLCKALVDKSKREFLEFKLHLPDQYKVMCQSTELVIEDNDLLKERMMQVEGIKFFVGFRELELTDIDPGDFLQSLPEELRPKALTHIVKEKFDEDLVILHKSPLASKIRNSIHSEEFVRGICRMFKKHKAGTFDSIKDVDSIKQAILKINVFEVAELQTHLVYQGNIVIGSNRQRMCFHHKKDGFVNFYFNLKGRDNFMALTNHHNGLSEVIRKHIGLPVEFAMITSMILQLGHDNPDKISENLDDLRYPPLHCDIDLDTISVFPRPGTYVEDKFHPFLEQSLDCFDKEEFLSIAMELEDEGIDTDSNDGMEVTPIFIYVHIKKEMHKDKEDQDKDNISLVKMRYLVDAGDTEAVEVPGHRLFRFVRPKRSSNETTLYTGATPQSFLPFDENCRRIREQLLDAWALPEVDRKRVIRRLLFHWHPDRNRGSEEYASQLFNYIKLSVLRLEETGSLCDEDETDGQHPDFSRSNYSSMYGNLNRRAKAWSRAYYDNLDDYNMNNRSGNYRHRDAFETEVKDLNEARRWMKQAKKDFQAASAYLGESEVKVSFNWICYMCHQASEKALKAACYAKNANGVSLLHHSLTQPAMLLTPSLVNLAQQMENHLGQHTRMRYPNAVDRPQIPAEIFTKDHAETAMSIAKEIIGGSSLLIE